MRKFVGKVLTIRDETFKTIFKKSPMKRATRSARSNSSVLYAGSDPLNIPPTLESAGDGPGFASQRP
jgi:hypothetical protein